MAKVVKVKDDNFELQDPDAALILALQELTLAIKRLKNGVIK